jgi:hypothetical protein
VVAGSRVQVSPLLHAASLTSEMNLGVRLIEGDALLRLPMLLTCTNYGKVRLLLLLLLGVLAIPGPMLYLPASSTSILVDRT